MDGPPGGSRQATDRQALGSPLPPSATSRVGRILASGRRARYRTLPWAYAGRRAPVARGAAAPARSGVAPPKPPMMGARGRLARRHRGRQQGRLPRHLRGVAPPAITHDLGGGFATARWVVDGYLLTLGSLVLVGGALGDLLVGVASTRRRPGAVRPRLGGVRAGADASAPQAALLMPGSLAILSGRSTPTTAVARSVRGRVSAPSYRARSVRRRGCRHRKPVGMAGGF